ncbi:MAG: glycosyltransferase family 4 protein [Elusimicrobiota bacterium]|nr:glycosyltransferase family 4 protein [Elusimicrobiota bacterium]
MKIAIVHKNIISAGGAERYMRNLAVLFAEQDYNVSVYAAKCDIVNNPNITFYKIKIIPFPPILKVLSFAINSQKEIKREKYDLIVGTGNVFFQDLYFLTGGVYSRYVWISLLKYRTFLGKFLRYVRRLLSPSHWLKLYIEKKIFTNDKTKFFICPSKIVADDLTEAYKIDGSKIKIIINGIDIEKFNNVDKIVSRKKLVQLYKFADDNFIFLFVSSNHFLKGLEPLLDAFYLLNKEQKNAKMIVVGKGREDYFRKKSEKMQLSNFVKFVGWQQDIREFYKAADFFIYPSFYDPFPNVALESLACGTPIIVSSLTGASEIIEDGKNGFVIKNPRDAMEIFDKMKKVISLRKEKLMEMSVTAKKTAENFSNEKHIKKIMEFVRAICPS